MGATRETPRQLFTMMHAALPDVGVGVHEMLQDGDEVVRRVTMGATHQRELMGVPATGNRVEVNAIDIPSFRGDECIAHRGLMDTAGMLDQT